VRPITVRIACVQLAARSVTQARGALDDALAGIAAAAALGAHIAVLPECTYPGYVLLRRETPGGAAGVERALRDVRAAAVRAGIAVCIGVARRGDDGVLRNEAVFIDRRGAEIARYQKIFLWNFDVRWFAPGRAVPAFDTEFGILGMMICADGRMPEIARTLARRGAWLVLDPTAWVSAGPSYEQMHNPQVDYAMSVRARENGLWIAAADKCGSELGAVHYVGRSMIVAPDGSMPACAPASMPAVIVADVERRREHPFVASLSEAERRALRARKPPSAKSKAPKARVGVLQGPFRAGRANAVAALRAQGVEAVVETAASARSIHAALDAVRGLRSNVIAGTRMLAPEPARAAALRGADVLVWTGLPKVPGVQDVARTRALENRVYVIVCSRTSDADASVVVDPNGDIIGSALTGEPSGYVASIDASGARDKVVAPGSDVFAARIPRAFALFDGRLP
jgi:predicted amidohydrolase